MPRSTRLLQRRLETPSVVKLVVTAALLLIFSLTALYTFGQTQGSVASYADEQIDKLHEESHLSNVDPTKASEASHDELTTGEIFHAVHAQQNSDSQQQDTTADSPKANLDSKEVSHQAELARVEASRQAELEAERLLISRQAEPVSNVVYFNNPDTMASLGCPAISHTDVVQNHTCFYHNPSSKSAAFLPKDWEPDPATGCAAVFRPLPADFGRPWCLQKNVSQGSVGVAMKEADPKDVLHLKGMTLLLGQLSGPNPTHQLNIHFYNIYLWMKKSGIPSGELQLVVDCPEPSKMLGAYGIGLGRALGDLHFLPQLPPVTTFDQVKFSLPVGFQFDIHKHELDKTLDCNLMELTWAVKQYYGVVPDQKVNPKRVVIAVRRAGESRAFGNAPELLTALELQGYNASLVTFGDLTFKQQLQAVSDAAVLVGVTGSDLVNLAFLPLSGSIVEIFPVVQGQQVFTPELWNLAHMAAKNHLKYIPPYNSTALLDSQGHLMSDRPVHQVKSTDVHVPSLVALIGAAALASKSDDVVWNRMSIEPHSSGKGIKCWDRTQT